MVNWKGLVVRLWEAIVLLTTPFIIFLTIIFVLQSFRDPTLHVVIAADQVMSANVETTTMTKQTNVNSSSSVGACADSPTLLCVVIHIRKLRTTSSYAFVVSE